MTRQLLLALWNRRRKNALILVEVFISFLVLFGIVVSAFHFGSLYSRPLGFEYEDVWSVRMSSGNVSWDEASEQTVNNALQVVRDLEPVVGAEAISMSPFQNSRWITTLQVDGREASTMINLVGQGFDELVGLEPVAGRWFGREDDGLDWESVVVSQLLVDELLAPGVDPIGAEISEGNPERGRKAWRIVGVIPDFRQIGELSERQPYLFRRYPETGGTGESIRSLAVRVRPGTDSSFEPALLDALRAVNPSWDYYVRPWSIDRENQLRQALTPLLTAATIGLALLLMVALGLLGVLWQSVTVRTVEFGLRRAVGASARRIYRQVTLELVLLVSLGSALGAILAIQVPMIGVFPIVTWGNTFVGLLGTGLLMTLIAMACAFYPSWLAMQIEPAEALHYE